MADNGQAAFRAAAQALNEAGDKELRREVYAAFKKAAKPLGERIVREGAAGLPRRGGLSARVAAAKVGQSNSTTGRNPGVAITLRTKPGNGGKSIDLRAIDVQGKVKHPVFGRRKVWRVTNVRSQLFTDPFEAGREPVAREVVDALQTVADRIQREAHTRGPHQ
jgi:hypothetical protein